MLAYLLAAGAGGVKILLGVAFDLRCATAPRFNFVTEIAEAIGQFRLIYGSGKLLWLEQAALLSRRKKLGREVIYVFALQFVINRRHISIAIEPH
jgi:hypothetical protein